MDDILPLTPAFAPEQIAKYVGVKWTDGKSFLLTCLGPGVALLTAARVAQYKKAVDTAPYQPAHFPVQLMLDLREQMRSNPHWLTDLRLPGITSN